MLIALFPNRAAEAQAFHRLWGRVHPVMLNDDFVTAVLRDQVVYRGSLSESDLSRLRLIVDQASADGSDGDLSGSKMLMLARNL